MSSDSNSTKTCWNCDEVVDDLTMVVITTPSGGNSQLALCPRCYASVYQPLAPEVMALRPNEERRRSVLIVDDDTVILRGLALALTDQGFHVVTATSGLEALRCMESQTPEVILLDLRMPVMNGREFLSVWRSSMPTTSVPVVAMSAYQREEIAPAELGVQAFLSKPFCLSALTRVILSVVA
jgi:CheY-like chemotaxis protein